MKKIQKCQMGAAIGLDLAPYSYSAPALGTAVGSLTKGLTSAIPAAAPYAGAAGALLAVPASMGAGFYVLGNPQHGGVSGAMQAAAERERQRHLAQAEKQWQEKNQYYADLLSTHGPIKYPVGTFYDYDQSTGTAYLEKDLGNGLIGRWTQNMRTREQGNPRAYNPITGEVYEGTFTGPHTVTIPITLSNGQVVSLPTDLTDYRVFDEAANPSSDSQQQEQPQQQEQQQQQQQQQNPRGNRNQRNNKRSRNNKNESDFARNFRQGRQDAGGNNRPGYKLGKAVGWMENHQLLTLGLGGLGIWGVPRLWNAFKDDDNTTKGAATSNSDINASALDGNPSNVGQTGTAMYQWDEIPRDTTSTYPVYLP